jgi:hypothetical protein
MTEGDMVRCAGGSHMRLISIKQGIGRCLLIDLEGRFGGEISLHQSSRAHVDGNAASIILAGNDAFRPNRNRAGKTTRG